MPSAVHDLAEDAGEELAHPNRLGHVGLSRVWAAMDVETVAVDNRQRGREVTGRCLSASPTGLDGSWCSRRRRLGC
jgi:hypothetical protein